MSPAGEREGFSFAANYLQPKRLAGATGPSEILTGNRGPTPKKRCTMSCPPLPMTLAASSSPETVTFRFASQQAKRKYERPCHFLRVTSVLVRSLLTMGMLLTASKYTAQVHSSSTTSRARQQTKKIVRFQQGTTQLFVRQARPPTISGFGFATSTVLRAARAHATSTSRSEQQTPAGLAG
jgi:hypothetical protein